MIHNHRMQNRIQNIPSVIPFEQSTRNLNMSDQSSEQSLDKPCLPIAVLPPPPINRMIPREVAFQYIASVDQLWIKRTGEIEIAYDETNYPYWITNALGQQIFRGQESSNSAAIRRNLRDYRVKIADNSGQLIMVFDKPTCCPYVLTPCCKPIITVKDYAGQLLGTVMQLPKFCCHYIVNDATGKTCLRILADLGADTELDADFYIHTADKKSHIGTISKYNGFDFEYCIDQFGTGMVPYRFGITFPVDLSVAMKACLMAAVYLIDYINYDLEPLR